MPSSLYVADHPIIRHMVGLLRHRDTPPLLFRTLVHEISQALFYEATRDLRLTPVTVPTPLAACPAQKLTDRIGIVPVLRAGLGMADALITALPEASVWHLGLYRDETTLKPVTYYNKLPPNHGLDLGLVLDPMLATGGSAGAAIGLLKEWGLRRIRFLGLIAAPEGVRVLQDAHPDVDLYLAALDDHLNEHSYIVPGLGDAGDRQFGTRAE